MMASSVNSSSTGGRPTAESARFSVPLRPNVATKPMATMMEGMTNGRMVSERSVSRPRNSKRANSHAAGRPSARLASVE